MKKIEIYIDEINGVQLNHEGFASEFEINGLLQTVLLHRCINLFSNPDEESK